MRSLPVIASLLMATAALAQSPYSGMQTRSIKALSDEQIADLNAGRGMGLALPAELNGYPGPRHVLDLADGLGLSQEQRGQVQKLFDAMQAEAIAVGARLIAQEAELEREFSGKTITSDKLRTLTGQIASTQGRLRETHLKYHLSTVALLTPQQVQQYATLRGYGEAGAPAGHGQHHGQHHRH